MFFEIVFHENLKLNHFEIKDKGNHINETCLRQKDFVSNLKGKIK